MKPTPVVIVGGGGHGSDVLSVLEAINQLDGRYEIMGYADDVPPANRRLDRRGVAYLGTPEDALTRPCDVVIAIGDPNTRHEMARRLTHLVSWSGPIVHPSASMGAGVTMEPGVVVFAHASVSAEARLGEHVHVGQQVAVGHDAVIGDFSSVFPGAVISGEAVVGPRVLVGSNATILPGRSVGDGSAIGAGAVVVADVPPGMRAVGVPARWGGH